MKYSFFRQLCILSITSLSIFAVYTALLIFHNIQSSNTSTKIKKRKPLSEESTHINSGVADGIIRVLFYEGCSGSSATFRTAQQILDAHGFKSYRTKSELDKPKKNQFYYEARQKVYDNGKIHYPTADHFVIEAFKLLNAHILPKNKILFTKLYYNRAHLLEDFEGAYAAMFRRNKLDVAICYVNDCFGADNTGLSELGYSTFANNDTKTGKLCFQRRSYDNLSLNVQFNTDKLIDFIQNQVKEEKEHVKKIKALISPAKVQYYEDLFEFTYTNDYKVFKKSIEAWCSLLRSITAYIDEGIVREVLLPLKNTRKSPSLHKSSIKNFYSVKNALEEAKLDYFLRL